MGIAKAEILQLTLGFFEIKNHDFKIKIGYNNNNNNNRLKSYKIYYFFH